MSNTLTGIYLHIIFRVKSTSVLMQREDLPRIFEYIGGLFRKAGSPASIVGGMPDHIHAVPSLSKNISVSTLMRNIKSYSSRWIKTLHPIYSSFAWQDGYGAFSVSATILPRVIKYIETQEQHHQQKSYQDEFKEWLEAYHVPYDAQNAFRD